MPKLITVKRIEGNVDRAREYVRTYILFPSSLLGLIFLVSATASLGYQLMVTDSYTGDTFFQSMGLLVLGGVVGWVQTRYQRYLLKEFPDHFASRIRMVAKGSHSRSKRHAPDATPLHPGRRWIPLAYLAGGATILTASSLSAVFGHVYYVAAYLLPWAGFFWAKVFFWRGVLPTSSTGS